MDDYYELLGVEHDAPVDDIRSAYRDKKAAVDTSASDDAKSDVAKLNKAWNVLSDPYQRGRYDQQRADVGDSDEYDDDGDEEETAPVSRRPKPPPRSADRAEKRRQRGAPVKPTINLPAGEYFPATSRRLTAMVIDIFVLILLFVASQLLVVSLEKSHHAEVYRQVTKVLPDKITKAHDATNAAKKASSAADTKYADLVKSKGAKADDTLTAQDEAKRLDAITAKAKAAEDALNKQLTTQASVLTPTSRLISGLFFLVALLVLMVPSILTRGQTIGKRFQRVRVVRIDGSPPRFVELFRRYTVLVFAAYALFSLAGPIGGAAVLFVATMWTRNPNQQALQDRFAKTLVVTDVAP